MANLTKDQRLIKENPGKSPYELKVMGLSDKGFTDLLAKQGLQEENSNAGKQEPTINQLRDIESKLTETIATPVAAKVSIIPQRAVPQTQAARPMQMAEGQAILKEKKSGKQTPMSRASAERWAKKHPGQYDVI